MPEEYLGIIEFLLSKGAKVDMTAKRDSEYVGMTPLHDLCFYGPDSPEVAKLLLDHGAVINREWSTWWVFADGRREAVVHTVFSDACNSGHFRLAEYLLTRGAKKDSTSIEILKYKKQKLEASVKEDSSFDLWQTDMATLKIFNRILEYK